MTCDTFAGVLLGTAVGDSLGLPAEGMSRRRIRKLWQGKWRHRFLFGHGMISDDTEHTLFVAQALLTHPDDPATFQRCLAGKLRLWLLGLPAGIGLATLRAILKLWAGISPNQSGVHSAGNGPAMRSALIGAYFAEDPATRRTFVAASTQITHTDPRAETAALAVAEAAAWAVRQDEPIDEWLSRLRELGTDMEWKETCRSLVESLAANLSVEEFADSLGLRTGVTGYAYHCVPVALFAWLRLGEDFRNALESVLNCGGDTDTTGAIVGALCGARSGRQCIPGELLAGILEWPRSPALLQRVATRLAKQKKLGNSPGPIRYFWPGIVPRNILFLLVVLLHGLRRLAPPY